MSRMPMKRVVEVIGGRNLVIRNRVNNRRTQKWTFDQVTKTIKSLQYQSKSVDIQNYGRSNNLQIWATSSRWF